MNDVPSVFAVLAAAPVVALLSAAVISRRVDEDEECGCTRAASPAGDRKTGDAR